MSSAINTETVRVGDDVTTSYITTLPLTLNGGSLNEYLNSLQSPSSSFSTLGGFVEEVPTDNTTSPVSITNMVLLSTLTQTTVVSPDIDIFTFYDENVDINIQNVFISTDVGIYNGVSYVEGDLLALIRDFSGSNIYINADGTLSIEDDDSDKYSVDAQTGNLIYTE
jgi:hypothetical protein